MKTQIRLGLMLAAAVVSAQTAQSAQDTPEAHVELARAAAGEDYQNLFNFLCAAPGARRCPEVWDAADNSRRVS